MMLLKREKVLLAMKFFSALFLLYILSTAIRVLYFLIDENKSETINNEIISTYKQDFCNKYWLFHIFAFALGAFWNVRKLQKVGII